MTEETGKVKSKSSRGVPQRTYTCRTKTCREYNRPRTVTLQHLGQEIYLDSPVVCGVCCFPAQNVGEKGFKR